MENAVVSAAINKIVDIGATLVVEESSRLYWLREDILWLEQQMRLLRAYLQVAEEKKVTVPTVATFIKGIRNLAYDVEDVFDIFLPKIQEHKSSALLKRMACIVPYSATCSKFSREIEKIKRRVQGIKEDKENYSIPDIISPDGAHNSIVDPRTTTLDFEDSVIVGFDEDIRKLRTRLKEHQFVSIVGMAGLGKTTLAKKVFKSVKDEFDCCASVSVSQDPNIEALLIDIAKQVDLEEEKQKINLRVHLHALLQEKRYLLLLDDVWSTDAWDSLKGYFPIDSESASRIIVTSRDNGVGNYVGGEDSVHQLLPFDFPTSWELFSKLILSSNFDHPELIEIGEKIVKKCGGVPLAIVVAVGMLRERGMREVGWNEVLNNIGHDANDKCSRIIGLSYIDLPTTLKPYFLYFGNFPEDYEFSSFDLIRMWEAEKFIQRVGHRDVEDIGKDCLSKLDSRNLIQVVKRELDGSVKKFRVHDLLHSLCVEKGREIDFLNTIDGLDPASSRLVRRLGIFGDDDILEYNLPNIRGLFHFENGGEIEEKRAQRILRLIHHQGMLIKSRLLRVLTLRSNLNVFLLLTSVGSLSYLNYLQITLTKLDTTIEIPLSIQNLKNLETLIVESMIVVIPVRIWKMEQLKHLHLKALFLVYHKYDYYLQLPPVGIQVSLPNIQTLHLPEPIQTRPKYSSMLPKLTTLRKLKLWIMKPDVLEVLCGREPISNNLHTFHCWSCMDCGRGTRMNLSKYGMLAKFKIRDYSELDLHEHDLPPSLIKVTISACPISNSTMSTLKKLPRLKILRLMEYSKLGSKMDCSGGFPQLQVLELRGLDDLEELVEGEGEEMGMPRLKQLIIDKCPELVRIPERLQQLRAQTN